MSENKPVLYDNYTINQLAEDISPKLAKNAMAAVFNGKISDLNSQVKEDG